jgi:hypothetical protein
MTLTVRDVASIFLESETARQVRYIDSTHGASVPANRRQAEQGDRNVLVYQAAERRPIQWLSSAEAVADSQKVRNRRNRPLNVDPPYGRSQSPRPDRSIST